MAKFIFEMSQSLDGYVDHTEMMPGPALFRHFVGRARALTGSVYGRHVYGLMQYWDGEDPNWDADRRDFALAWRRQPKWVVSHSLTSVGPNATLVEGDLETAMRALKAQHGGEIAVAGPQLAKSLGELGLIDEYRIYVRPYVLGSGAPFFVGPRSLLRLVAHDLVGEDTIQLTYVPA